MDQKMQELDNDNHSIKSGVKSKAVTDGMAEQILLSRTDGSLIAEFVNVPELKVEIERAVQQVEKSISKQQEFQEEKLEIEATTKNPTYPDR